jgi:hypothetical protein
MLYARLNDEGRAFEPERNVLTWAAGLDGGGSIAADPKGNVYVAWHGSPPKNEQAEAGRAVFIAHSQDDGRTFRRERLVNPEATGACGCCGMRAFADSQGRLFLLYRAASAQGERGMRVLASPPQAEAFQLLALDRWKLSTCPMSSASLTEGGGTVLAAWENQDQVHFSAISYDPLRAGTVIHPAGRGKRKHPALARNARGETLLAWAEGTGWAKGGTLAWQLFEASGQAVGAITRQDGVPVWGLLSVAALLEGDFVIFY